MARSMIARRQEAERNRLAAYDATLKRAARTPRPAPDFDTALKEALNGTAEPAIRSGADWHPQMKTRDAGKLRLAAARHLYARYAVPAHLEAVWLDAGGLNADETRLRQRWFAIAGGGRSLYKEGAGEWLSRKEVHAFLNPPGAMAFDEAFWQAVARSYTDDLGLALRIARSKIARTGRLNFAFWREAVRFFIANPAPLETVDDLCDYLAAAIAGDRAYSLKGRTLGSLTRQMLDWHRDVAAVRRIEAAQQRAARAAGREAEPAGRWAGSPLQDWSWQLAGEKAKARREEFVVTQLNTAGELVAETRAMHHCVSTYAAKCIAGQASIWSLRLKTVRGAERLLTIELDRCNRAVQVRGFANRLAKPEEVQVLSRWAKARGIAL
ncbi:MAG: PcfJ domain-containing protein [Rhizobiaceae bacterium]|nr:PcfJ domain-containing protein [Rhizobiaceae bacterium]MBX3532663.1 PcfJ domain-containing protein [Rhizobiaceae bacterium]